MLVIYFRDELHETVNGFSPGGAVFYYELIKKVDLANRTLYLIDPVDIKEWDELVSFKFEVGSSRTIIVYIRKDIISSYDYLKKELAVDEVKNSQQVKGRIIRVRGNEAFRNLDRTVPVNWSPYLDSLYKMMEKINQGEKIGKETPVFVALKSTDVLANFKHLVTELEKDGMTKKDIARLFDVTLNTLCLWETEEKLFDCVDRLILITLILDMATNLYDVSPSQFLLETKLNCSGGRKSIIELLESNEIEPVNQLRIMLIEECS